MPKLSVFWSERSINDLEEIREYLKKQASEKTADKVVKKLLKREEQLSKQALSGAVQSLENLSKEYRYLIEGQHKLIYHIESDMVYVDTIFDTRQDPSNLKL
jgi:addiction module RelE/StbE family toxin